MPASPDTVVRRLDFRPARDVAAGGIPPIDVHALVQVLLAALAPGVQSTTAAGDITPSLEPLSPLVTAAGVFSSHADTDAVASAESELLGGDIGVTRSYTTVASPSVHRAAGAASAARRIAPPVAPPAKPPHMVVATARAHVPATAAVHQLFPSPLRVAQPSADSGTIPCEFLDPDSAAFGTSDMHTTDGSAPHSHYTYLAAPEVCHVVQDRSCGSCEVVSLATLRGMLFKGLGDTLCAQLDRYEAQHPLL
jgi:hypothetical protein